MGVQETIDAYLLLAKDVFQERPQSLVLPNFVGALVGTARFSGEKLATAVKRIVEAKTRHRDTPFFETRENPCRV
jgi:hypothetical protein